MIHHYRPLTLFARHVPALVIAALESFGSVRYQLRVPPRAFIFVCTHVCTQVLIDEATQATEPECLIPIVTGAKHLVVRKAVVLAVRFVFTCMPAVGW